MTKKISTLKLAWQSSTGKRAAWAIMIASFVLTVLLGSSVRIKEQHVRENTLIETAKFLADITLSDEIATADDMLLKVNDLINVDTVLGVRLMQGANTPLSVGETSNDVLKKSPKDDVGLQWADDKSTLDIVLYLPKDFPYSHFILRIDAQNQIPPPYLGTVINWVAAPLISFVNGLVFLWVFGHFSLRPLSSIQNYFKESNGKYALASVPHDLRERDDETGLIARSIETMRLEVNESKAQIEFQARFLHETPSPLLRCSVNRKVLYANIAAKAEASLFGDESKEFVSPALSELVRQAFYEAKQVSGDIRDAQTIRTFRAIPVLDAGYVNLYGEATRKID